ERAVVEGRPEQQQVPQKVEGKPGKDDQDGQAQARPKQGRHFVGEPRPGTGGEAAAHVLRARALGTIQGRLSKVPLWKALAQAAWIAHGLLHVVRAQHASEGKSLAGVSGSATCSCTPSRANRVCQPMSSPPSWAGLGNARC